MSQPVASHGMKITILKDGPYRVTGGPPLSRGEIGANATGNSIAWVESGDEGAGGVYALCRCGHSANKPFCDGAHVRAGFDGTEVASRAPYKEQAKALEGPLLTMTDAEALCAFARFCDRAGNVWNTVFEVSDANSRARFIEQVGQCPSGRLVALDSETGEAIEPDLPPSIVVVADPPEKVAGPLWVRGGIEIVGADGLAYEVRNRVTLCRCGASANKPFCDGSHAHEDVKFTED